MPSLVFLAGPIAGRRYKLGDGEYVIGRRSDCQIFVPDMRVSRQHARLVRNGEGWTLEDLGSNNGTYINGVRLQSATGSVTRAPEHGEHTELILLDLGYDWDQIAAMKESGAVL